MAAGPENCAAAVPPAQKPPPLDEPAAAEESATVAAQEPPPLDEPAAAEQPATVASTTESDALELTAAPGAAVATQPGPSDSAATEPTAAPIAGGESPPEASSMAELYESAAGSVLEHTGPAASSTSPTSFEPPERRQRSATEPAPGEKVKTANRQQRDRTASELDIAKGDAVLRPMQTLPGLVAHTVGNLVGGATLGAGWALGKADVAVGRRGGLPVPGLGGARQVSDSGAFKLGFRTWLYANGIMPTVLVESGPYGNDIGSLPQDPDARRRLLRSTPLIVSNHVSYLDTVVLPLVLEVPKLMAMSEVASWPLFGQLCQEMDMIWVDRTDPESRAAAKRAIVEHVDQWNNGERPLLIWPEGSVSNGRGLKDFKSGAFAPGVEVRPVIIKYTGEWDPSNVNFREAPAAPCAPSPERSGNSEGSVGGPSFDPAAYGDVEWAQQFFGHIIHSCTVLICRPYRPNEAEQKNPELFKDNVREHMRQRLEELNAREDRKRDEKERRPSFANGIKSARALFGNATKGADQLFNNVSEGLVGAWRDANTPKSKRSNA